MSGSAKWSLVQEGIALKAKTSPSSDKRPDLSPGSPILAPSDAASDFSVHIAFVTTALVLPLPINRSMSLLGAGPHPAPAATTQRTPCSHEHAAGRTKSWLCSMVSAVDTELFPGVKEEMPPMQLQTALKTGRR